MNKDRNINKNIIVSKFRYSIAAVLLLCLLPGILASFLPITPHQELLGWGMMGCAGILLLLWSVLLILRKLPEWGHRVFWWGAGYFLRFGYILRFPYYQMQHDVRTFEDTDGHAGYIAYLYHEGHLPDFDVREVWQFYHPPLHHALCAGWMHLLDALHLPEEQIFEGIQVLPFTYSCLMLAVFALLLGHFELKGAAFVIPFSIMALHPSQIILAGSLNNDMLSILFMGASLLLTLRWYREPKTGTLIGLALTIGLGMFTKLSAWMTAPAAAALFLLKLINDPKGQRCKRLMQYVLFGVICIPIGLFWSARNYLGWEVPPSYIPMLADDSAQYVGNHPIWERLFDLSPHQFRYIYDCYEIYGQDYSEYNPFIGLLKTAVFDEFVGTKRFPAVTGVGEVLFWTQVLLVVLTILAGIRLLHQKGLDPEKLALLVTYGVTLVSYVSFCIAYPHTCTQSFRYAVPTLYTSLLFLGIWIGTGTKSKPLRIAAGSVTGVFLAASFAVYGVLLYV